MRADRVTSVGVLSHMLLANQTTQQPWLPPANAKRQGEDK
jgi:hypothetical protein